MASVNRLHSILPLLLLMFLLLLQLSSTSQLRAAHPDRFKPKERPVKVHVDLGNVTKSMWDSGYKIMSLITEKNLPLLIPDSLVMSDRQGRNMISFFNTTKITIFAPPDEAIRVQDWIIYQFQVVMSKVDKQSFDSGFLSNGSDLVTCDHNFGHRLRVTHVPVSGFPTINNVKIIEWNIYNDGHVLVHGVEDFFDYRVFSNLQN